MVSNAYTSSLESLTIHDIHRIRILVKNSRTSICLFENKTFQWSRLDKSYLLRKAICGRKISDLDDSDILTIYRRKRVLVIGQLENQPAVVVDNEFNISFIKRELNKIHFELRSFNISGACVCTMNKKLHQNLKGKSFSRTIDAKETKDVKICDKNL